MSPELKAFRFYKKNIGHYIQYMEQFWGDDEKLVSMYKDIANKFNADYSKLIAINKLSYKRYVDRAFK